MRVIVLAGGRGVRLWPCSRSEIPKQFLRFKGGPSLLQGTVERCLAIPLVQQVLISTNRENVALVEEQIGGKATMVVEPQAKNTAAAIAFSLRFLEEREGLKENEPVLVLPSDHWIEPEEVFAAYVERMLEGVGQEKVALFGILPTRPETGYGYVQAGKPWDRWGREVVRFVEKPNRERAQEYLQSGDFFWNAGIFGFSPKVFWEEVESYAPELAKMRALSVENNVKQFYMLPSISIDYALMEKSKRVVVYPLPVVWSDVGSWDSIYDSLDKDRDGNVKEGDVLSVGAKGSLFWGESRLIAAVDVEDLIVVETGDALLVAKKGSSQNVKEIAQDLLKKGRKEGSFHNKHLTSWGSYRAIEEVYGARVLLVAILPQKTMEWEEEEAEWICLEPFFLIQRGEEREEVSLFEKKSSEGKKMKIFNPLDRQVFFLRLKKGEQIVRELLEKKGYEISYHP